MLIKYIDLNCYLSLIRYPSFHCFDTCTFICHDYAAETHPDIGVSFFMVEMISRIDFILSQQSWKEGSTGFKVSWL